MKLTGNKIFSFLLAAAFALTLAGCGGGGGSAAAPDPEPPTMPEPSAQEMCEADGGRYNADGSCTSADDLAEEMALSGAQEAAMAAYMAAMAAAGGAKDPVAMGKAQMYAGMAKEASDAAAMATSSEMAMEYQMKAEMNRDMAMEAAGMRGLGLTKLANKIINQAAIDNAVLEGKTGNDVPKPVSNAGRVGMALATTAGTAPVAAETPVAGTLVAIPNGSVGQGGAASARASHSASGPRLTAALPATVDAVTRGETPQGLTTRGGWMGAELVGSTAGATGSMTYANVYTDVQPTQMVSSYAAATGTATALPTDGTTSGVTGDIPGDGSDFEGTYNVNIADNQPPVSGLFDCPTPAPATGCSISVNADGELVSIQGYEFRAATGTTTKADGDYLAWGVWLRVPNAAPSATDATTNATAGAFASGSDVFTVNAALKGTATYNGVATGVYSAGGMVEYFDADVSLMANFGGNVGADTGAVAGTPDDNLLGAVTGSVTNIMAGGMDIDGMLTLKKANIIDGDDSGSHAGGFTSTVSGTLAGRAMVGNWGGQFYGPNKASGKGIETEYPTTAAGTFGASAPGNVNDPIRILGSFGTWKAE
ncbi:MAG: hypothetical protein F4Y03_17895 [Alphaproteobacteria bacterium]|nr:hypothetical protein [Alphaproteobacteria bacterium]